MTRSFLWFLSALTWCCSILTTLGCAGDRPGPGDKRHAWPVFGGDSAGSSQSPYLGPQAPNLAWAFATDVANDWLGDVVLSPVIDRHGNVYVGTGSGSIFSLNGTDGSTNWRFELTPSDPSQPYESKGTWYGALNSEGSILFAAFDYLLALDPDGTERWRFRKPGREFGTPLVDDRRQRIVVVSGPAAESVSSTQMISWIDFDGHEVAKHEFESETHGALPVLGLDGSVYIAYDDGILAVDKDGNRKWTFGLAEGLEALPPPFNWPARGQDGTLYFALATQPNCHLNTLYAINPDGTLEWKAKAGCSESKPAIAADGTIYVPSAIGGKWNPQTVGPDGEPQGFTCDQTSGQRCDNGGLRAFTPEGDLKWFYTETQCVEDQALFGECSYDGSTDGSPVIGKDGTIYLPTENGKVIALDPHGTVKWKANTREFWGSKWAQELDTEAVLDARGNLYVAYLGGPCAARDSNPKVPPCSLMVYNTNGEQKPASFTREGCIRFCTDKGHTVSRCETYCDDDDQLFMKTPE